MAEHGVLWHRAIRLKIDTEVSETNHSCMSRICASSAHLRSFILKITRPRRRGAPLDGFGHGTNGEFPQP